jgi:hypothetical protein
MTSTHGNVTGLSTRVENLVCNLYVGNFSLPQTLMICTKKGHNLLWYCQAKSKRNMYTELRKLRLKRGCIKYRAKGDLTAIV